MESRPPCRTMHVKNVPCGTWHQLQRHRGPTELQGATVVAGDTIVDPPIFLPGPTEAVKVDVEAILTMGVRISIIMDMICTYDTVTAAIITAIIGIMAGVMMNSVAIAGMNAGVITRVAMEMATAVVDMGDIPITWVRSAAAIILVSAHPSAAGSVEGVLHTLSPSVGSQV